MNRKPVTELFLARSGRIIAYHDVLVKDARGREEYDHYHAEQAFSLDGQTFYEVKQRGFGGTTKEHGLTFACPQLGIDGRWARKNGIIKYDGETFVLTDRPFDASKIVPLPEVRKLEYFCGSDDGFIVYVSADEYNHTHESFRLYVGTAGAMRQIKVLKTSRFRGGDTVIQTDEYTFVAASSSGFVPYNWGGMELAKLDENDYNIVETPDGLAITSLRMSAMMSQSAQPPEVQTVISRPSSVWKRLFFKG